MADPLSNEARSLSRLGRHDEALATFRAALAIVETTEGNAHPDAAMLHTGIGAASLASGDLEGSLAAHRRAYAIRKAKLGPQKAKTGESAVNMADVYRRMDQGRKAQSLLGEWLPVLESKLGAEHRTLVAAKVTLGWIELDAEQHAKAAEIFRSIEEHVSDKDPQSRAILDLGLGLATFPTDPDAARKRLVAVAALTGPGTSGPAARARKFLDAQGDPS